MKSSRIEPFVHDAASVGHGDATSAVMLASRQFTEITGAVGVSVAGLENAVINAIGMFIHDKPTTAGAREK
jgi:hypothetical protein